MTAAKSPVSPAIEDVIAEVRRIAAQNPAVVYRSGAATKCVYVRNGIGDCIVGKALVTLGVPASFFDTRIADGVTDTINSKRIDYGIYELLGWRRGPQLAWLTAVQIWQDLDEPWGAVIAKADMQAPL
ncbi:hypothetical protein F5X71_34850 [Nocardia brasiliensis]|uniref:Uncharacterized protein n=1 Tax=Nocardia brasiliensis TaxID=37326 RepID=A0A6G9Y0S4_NOCBR|nr:hypothetical protein [Nocardia brasiliensis]QIS06805.1 hypothetical protein F5X71_34850 [Nocardia brasiliensis]